MPKQSSRRGRRQRSGHAKTIVANPFLALLASVKQELDRRLEAHFADQLEVLAPYGREVSLMMASLARLGLRGGKRLRPALLATGFCLVTPEADLEPALQAGLALELLHTYLLVHDDWMDGDVLRRGGPTVHAELAKRFKSQHRGNATAILAGDFASTLALDVLAGVELPAGRAGSVLAAFGQMQRAAILGQVLDIASDDHDPEAIYALKTASYTVLGPLRLGALLAGAKPATLRTLEAYATPVGIAFQLADDLLSAFGNPQATGKALGNDIRAGKRTPLVLEGMKRARGRDRRLLTQAFGNARASQTLVAQALAVLEKTGARRRSEARIEALLAQGQAALGKGVSRRGRELLEGAALALTARRA